MHADSELLDLLTKLQAAAEPIDISHGDEDARVPAALWREFVDAHAAALYASKNTPNKDVALRAAIRLLEQVQCCYTPNNDLRDTIGSFLHGQETPAAFGRNLL